MTKARPDSLAGELMQAGLYEDFCVLIFEQSLGYAELLEWLEEHNIARGSMAALSRFNQSERSRYALDRGRRIVESMKGMDAESLGEAEKQVVNQRVFELAINPHLSESHILRLRDQHLTAAKLRQDAVKLEQAEKKLAQSQEIIDLQKRKIEALEAQQAATKADLQDGGLTDEERAAKMRARFGL